MIFHLVLGIVAFALDTLTKWWARAFYGLPNGEPDYSMVTPILGDWLRFRLVFNEGAAFGVQAQNLAPFLHPTIFYSVTYFVVMGIFLYIYFKAGVRADHWLGLGIALVLSGGMGNTMDRLVFHRVTDFIDVEFFNLNLNLGPLGFFRMDRWPVFNLADSWIMIGGALMLLSPFITWRRSGEVPESPEPHAVQANAPEA